MLFISDRCKINTSLNIAHRPRDCHRHCCNHSNKYPWSDISSETKRVKYCPIYNILILDRFLYIFVPYTLLKFSTHKTPIWAQSDATTHEEKFRGYSVSLRTYSVRRVPDGSAGAQRGTSERLETFGIRRFYMLECFISTYTHTAVTASVVKGVLNTNHFILTQYFLLIWCQIQLYISVFRKTFILNANKVISLHFWKNPNFLLSLTKHVET